MYYLDNNIRNLHRIFDQNERKDYLRLDLNENPDGLDETFIKETLQYVDKRLISEYPETLEFTEKLAKYLNTDINHICLVNGSAEGIRYIIQAFTSANGRIVGVVPSYFMFQVYSSMYGRNFVPVPYEDDLSIDINKIIGNITDDTQLMILLNPNNPMGNAYTEGEFLSILKRCEEKEVTVLIDEAYHYFYPIKYALNKEHIFVTRTFSKLFSLAGLRLGYVAGWPEGIKMVQKMCTPHNVNAIALLFAQRIIENPNLLDSLINDFNEGRRYLVDYLDEHNYEYQGEYGNFIFIKPHQEADLIVKTMKEKYKILIKSYDGIGKFGKCLRVSIGNKKCMSKFIQAFREIDQ